MKMLRKQQSFRFLAAHEPSLIGYSIRVPSDKFCIQSNCLDGIFLHHRHKRRRRISDQIRTKLTPSTGQGGHQCHNGEQPSENHHGGHTTTRVNPLVPMRMSNHDESIHEGITYFSFQSKVDHQGYGDERCTAMIAEELKGESSTKLCIKRPYS